MFNVLLLPKISSFSNEIALLAQSVARMTLNHKVRGSSPLQGYLFFKQHPHFIVVIVIFLRNFYFIYDIFFYVYIINHQTHVAFSAPFDISPSLYSFDGSACGDWFGSSFGSFASSASSLQTLDPKWCSTMCSTAT